MKAIETEYKGYRMRSRLEARWAVFFDAFGIKWEYEKNGFDLSGEWYLPDFWLPQVKLWGEVKPKELFDDRAYRLCRKLAEETGYGCIALIDSPDFTTYPVIGAGMMYENSSLDDWLWHDILFGNEYLDEGRFYSGTGATPLIDRWCEDDRDYQKAVYASRHERFEKEAKWVPEFAPRREQTSETYKMLMRYKEQKAKDEAFRISEQQYDDDIPF